jgi:O-acetyl-ADP-ribose deacetylase (regulator of RNase III)
MIKSVEGNILDASENVICQQVNCKGIMGAGLAKDIILRYPVVYSQYRKYCNIQESLLGNVLYIMVKIPNKIIACLFGQDDYGRSNKVYTNYQALEQALTKVCLYAKENNYSIAIPYELGCGLANGDWNIVYDMIKRVFENFNVTIYRLEK